MIIGAAVLGLALALDLTLHPPFWVHVLLWVPITAAAVVFGLRFGKALLFHLEVRNAAREGALDPVPNDDDMTGGGGAA